VAREGLYRSFTMQKRRMERCADLSPELCESVARTAVMSDDEEVGIEARRAACRMVATASSVGG